MSQKVVSHDAIRMVRPDAKSAHHHLNKVIKALLEQVPDFADSQEYAHLEQSARFLNTLDDSNRASVDVPRA
jgi:hypothetical protein